MKTHLPPAKYYDSDNDIMMSPTSLVFIIFYPPLIVSFHLAAVNTSCRSSFQHCHCPPSLDLEVEVVLTQRRQRRRRRRRRRVGGATPASTATATVFLHYDDFIEFDLINNDNADEPTTNENKNTWASRSQSSSLFPRLREILESSPISYSASITNNLMQQLSAAGFVDDNDITQFARGFIVREEELSQILIHDFRWNALDAHRARVGIIALVREEELFLRGANHEIIRQDPSMTEAQPTVVKSGGRLTEMEVTSTSKDSMVMVPPRELRNRVVGEENIDVGVIGTDDSIKPMLWKSVLVNDKAKKRRASHRKTTSHVQNGDEEGHAVSIMEKNSYNYGLLQSTSGDDTDRKAYATLYAELDTYWSYMTIPQTSAVSDTTIRDQTAKVYMTHARLFLGWVVDARGVLLDEGSNLLDEVLSEEGGESRSRSRSSSSGQETQFTSSLVSSFGGISSSSKASNMAKHVRKLVWRNVQERSPTLLSSFTSERTSKEEILRQHISLHDIFPNSQTESASSVLQYILWLRAERGISPNYEANILRGIIKLVKFRFANEMMSSQQLLFSQGNDMGSKHNLAMSARTSSPLDNLPIVQELRKLHREAGNKGKKAPRSSDESKKWLDWSEYLQVIQLLKSDLTEMIDEFDRQLRVNADVANADIPMEQSKTATAKSLEYQRKEIAKTYQYYLILSFFARVPDRQRTFRELELGRNFFKVEGDNESVGGSCTWVIKHTAEDYKTGSTYGERPPLPLTEALTPEIDDFLHRWRPSLLRKTSDDSTSGTTIPSSYLFLQPRTGNALTANSVYQIVSRCCYKYKQKKTNPHLLRDMIVTHVRKNADASEKELEALALFMGHSIQMQRDSYDRRTLEQKVSPAIKLMQSMNNSNS